MPAMPAVPASTAVTPPSPPGLLARAADAAYHAIVLKVAFQVLALLAMVLLVRVLSVEDFGAYNLVSATLPLMQLVGSFGLVNLLQRFVPEYYHAGRTALAARLVGVVATLRLVTSCLILALVFLFWDRLAPLVKLEAYRDYVLLFTVAIIAFQQWGLFKIALEARFHHRLTLGLQVGGCVLRCAGYALAFASESPLLVVLATDCLNFTFLAVSHALMYRRHRPRTPAAGPVRMDAGERRRTLRFAVLSHFNDAGVQLLDRGIDSVLIALFLDLPSVAVYAFCDDLARRAARLSPVSYLGDVVRPLVFARAPDLPRARLDAAVNVLTRANYAYYVPLFFAVALCGAELIQLIFGKYAEYQSLLLLILGFAVLNEIAFPVGLVAQLRERMDIVLYSKVAGLYNLVAALVLIPAWGVWGAAVATGTAGLFRSLFIWWFVRREFSLGRALVSTAWCALYWAAGTGLLALVARLADLSPLVVAAAGLPFLACIYFRVLFRPDADEQRLLLDLGARNRLAGKLAGLLIGGRR